MAQPTPQDEMHASIYGSYVEQKERFIQMRKLYPHILTHCEWVEEGDPLIPADRLPKTSPGVVPRKARIVMDKVGCHQISCFKLLPGGTECGKNDPARWLQVGDETAVLACQPACHNFNEFKKEISGPFVHWWRGECRFAEMHAVKYASDPTIRAEKPTLGVTNLKTGFDCHPEGFMWLNKSYCDYFGADYHRTDPSNPLTSECFVPIWQRYIVENILGKTIFRTFKRFANGLDVIVREKDKATPVWLDHLAVPKPMKDVAEWKKNVRPASTAAAAAAPELVERVIGSWKEKFEVIGNKLKGKIDKINFKEMARDAIKWDNLQELMISMGVDMAVSKVKLLVKKFFAQIMKSLSGKAILGLTSKLSGNVAAKALSFVVTHAVVRTVAGAAAKFLAKLIALGSSVVGWILVVLELMSFLLDFWDPYGLSSIHDQKVLDKNAWGLRRMMSQALYKQGIEKYEERLLDGRLIVAMLCEGMPKDHPVNVHCARAALDAYAEFLTNLDYNSIGQRLEYHTNVEVEQPDEKTLAYMEFSDFVSFGVEDADEFDEGFVPDVDTYDDAWLWALTPTLAAAAALLGVLGSATVLFVLAFIVLLSIRNFKLDWFRRLYKLNRDE